jgi:YhcG PDDEXK nuclease domain
VGAERSPICNALCSKLTEPIRLQPVADLPAQSWAKRPVHQPFQIDQQPVRQLGNKLLPNSDSSISPVSAILQQPVAELRWGERRALPIAKQPVAQLANDGRPGRRLSTGGLEPEFSGGLNFYLSGVDEIMRSESDAPTIGLLLCKNKDGLVAEYALRDINKPMGVSIYTLSQMLPESLRNKLPSIEQLERELGLGDDEDQRTQGGKK